ncbi:CHC2 zinc finger domain-containing protein [Chitinimonas sp. BJB300]|uniref:CHC2 zinc finger domain-containing protein n=3 Tax=Chitinimonas sp. BJB300 TaxID=1559339 RepID=UPI0011129D12|nr:CHC2 zinc finger domain-containing protein [Chitinimonas sp. BJB300]TSJ83238.1 toprim domain-containing protein [Chitinimonas sp. BJB300]
MARIPEAEIERLKTEVSLVRLIEADGIALSKQGKDYAACCPFHQDDSPSLVVTPGKNLFHCFGCGAAGGPIDWVMKRRGISFRHAAEWLREGLPSLLAASLAPVKRTTARALPVAVSLDADDHALLGQVMDYYHATLKQEGEALAYLVKRGLDHPELIDTFKLGYANRTLGLHLPEKNRQTGAEVRGRLQHLGLMRETGHEHFAGSLVIPVQDSAGQVVEIYGRKLRDDLRKGTAKHLYLPGPHAGVWNEAGLAASGGEVVLCEALIDAMTFWCAGYRNVTASYGTQGFTADHLAAFQRHGVQRVLIAYDRDEAGERAAAQLAVELAAQGIGCWRVQFPHGLDANAYALKVQPASKGLGLVLQHARWLGAGPAPHRGAAPLPPLSPLAAPVPAATGLPPDASTSPEPALVVQGEDLLLTLADRCYRVRGLPKQAAAGQLKLNLLATRGDGYYIDSFDLYSAKGRAHYLREAALELAVAEEVLKRDLGRLLRLLEAHQDARLQAVLAPADNTPTMTDAAREAALTLLRDPTLLARIVADFDACGLVGERTNKLVGYLAAVSRKLAGPLAVVVQSSSAAGKSSLMDAVLSFIPEEERIKYSAMTGQSLFYMGENNLKHKILAICEEEGASRASYALKLLQSDGELTMASTGKDPVTGNLVTQQYRVEGPVMIFLTTTAIDIDEELLNRCLVLTVDEGREQTEAIHRLQRQKRTLAGLEAKQTKARVLALHQDAQRLLRPLAVVNPYADRLTFLADKTRTRRDHEKYLTLIDTIALLHQYQRPIRSLNGLDYVEVTPDDIAAANRLAHDVLGRSLDELPPQTRRLLWLLRDMVAHDTVSMAMHQTDYRFSRKQVRDYTGWGDTQLRLHLDRLTALEYLLVHRGGRGQSFVYELLYDAPRTAQAGGGSQPHLSGLIDADALSNTTSTGSSRGESPRNAGAMRAQNGPLAAVCRPAGLAAMPVMTGVGEDSGPVLAEMHGTDAVSLVRSYPPSRLEHPVAGEAHA